MGRFLEKKNNHFNHNKVLIHYRSYEMDKISAVEIANKSQHYAYFHNAVFQKSSELKILASCVTFACQDKVPPGSLYNVRALRQFK